MLSRKAGLSQRPFQTLEIDDKRASPLAHPRRLLRTTGESLEFRRFRRFVPPMGLISSPPRSGAKQQWASAAR
jgi:hypothetical protein